MQPYDQYTSWVKSPWNYVNFLVESPLNSLDLNLRKIIEPCNSFLGKVRVSQRTLLKKLGGNPERVSHSFAEFTVVKACLLKVNWQI